MTVEQAAPNGNEGPADSEVEEVPVMATEAPATAEEGTTAWLVTTDEPVAAVQPVFTAEKEEDKLGVTGEAAAVGPVIAPQQLTTGGKIATVGEVAGTAVPGHLDYRLRVEIARLNARRERLQLALKSIEAVTMTSDIPDQ